MLSINAQSGAVILQHRPSRLRVVDRLDQFRVVLGAHELGIRSVPRQWIGVDHPLRRLRLSKEEPVIPALREPRVAPFQRVKNRYAVYDGQLADHRRMVEGHPKNHIAPAVVTCRGEAFVAEDAHQLNQLVGYRSLRLLVVIGSHLRFARLAIPGHVGTDDTVAGRCQSGRDAMPCRSRPGMTVDQKHRRTATTKPHPQPGLTEIDHFVAEALEHVLDAIARAPHRRPACSSWPSWSSTPLNNLTSVAFDKVGNEFTC